MSDKTILDLFYQKAQCGVPSHWCVQYKIDSSEFMQYEHFKTWTEANEYAMKYGYND